MPENRGAINWSPDYRSDSTGYSWAEAESAREEQREAYRKTKAERLDMLTEAAVLVDVIDIKLSFRSQGSSNSGKRLHEILDALRKILEEET